MNIKHRWYYLTLRTVSINIIVMEYISYHRPVWAFCMRTTYNEISVSKSFVLKIKLIGGIVLTIFHFDHLVYYWEWTGMVKKCRWFCNSGTYDLANKRPFLLTWINFYPSQQWIPLWNMWWHCLSSKKHRKCTSEGLRVDKLFHLTLHWACDSLPILKLTLIHVSYTCTGSWLPCR